MASDSDLRVPRSDCEIRMFDEDAFGFADYARSLGEELAQADPPFTLGIFGRWGRGKTSLMRLLEQALVEEKFKGQRFSSTPWERWRIGSKRHLKTAALLRS